MAGLLLLLQGIRIHVGFHYDQADWRFDPVDTYVVNDGGQLVGEIDDPERLGEIDAHGHFRSLRCLAEQAVNDDLVAAWEGDQRRSDKQLDRHAE